MNYFARTFLACVLLLAVVVGAANAADHRKRDGLHAAQEAFGAVDRTSGWCDDATTTPANIWDSANVPAEVSGTAAGLENRRAIRYLLVKHVDGTDTTTPMCVRLGPNTGSTPTRSALTCTGTAGSEATNGQMLTGRNEGRAYQIERIGTGDTPAAFVRSSSGSVRYCVEVSWHS